MEEKIAMSLINRWDDEALNLLYSRFYKSLVVYSCQLVTDMVSAEDIVQDTFEQLWRGKRNFETLAQLKVYMFNTVRNRSINLLRAQKVRSEKIELIKQEHETFQLSDADREDLFGPEVYRQLMLMIEQMPERQRKVFLMSMNGKKNQEIAEALDISVNTVKTQKRRGLLYLKSNMEQALYLMAFFLTFNE